MTQSVIFQGESGIAAISLFLNDFKPDEKSECAAGAETQNDVYRKAFCDWLADNYKKPPEANEVRLVNLTQLLEAFADDNGSYGWAVRQLLRQLILSSTAGRGDLQVAMGLRNRS